MAFKTFTNGSILTDTDLNDYLMKQSVIVCTSGTRPSSPVEGMTIYETDTNRHVKWTGGAWEIVAATRVEGHVPSLTVVSGTNPTMGSGSSNQGHYTYMSGSIVYSFAIRFGTSGAAAGSGSYVVAIPVAGALPFTSAIHPAVGTLQLADNSAGTFATGTCFVDASSPSRLVLVTTAGPVTNASPWVWASSDYLSGTITYPI